MPGAFSFISGANQLRFVASYKAQLFHLESHAFLLRKHEGEVRDAREKFEYLLHAVKPVMQEKTTLAQALQILVDNEQEAA